jgi:hypothetical protein
MRHQHNDDRTALDAASIVKCSYCLPFEFPDQHRLAHPAFADEEDVLHALSRRLCESLI